MKNRFVLFAGNVYYYHGGAYDFKGSFPSIEDAINAHDPNEFNFSNGQWANILDLEKGKMVKQFVDNEWCDYNHLQ